MNLFKKFPLGRLGNNLFQIAFIMALSERTKTKWALPEWRYSKYFNFKWNVDGGIEPEHQVREANFDYSPILASYRTWEHNVDFYGYFQSEKYFDDVWDKIKYQFTFDLDFLYGILDRSDFRPGENDWAVHVRLGDFVKNKAHAQIPASYYTDMFKESPENEHYVFTDDYALCKKMLGKHNNVQYVEGCSDIEHLALMAQFKNFVIANSSFSWWAAKLSELYHKGGGINVIRPDCLFIGDLARSCTGNDFYPDRWVKRQLFKKIKGMTDLKDVTFAIPVKYDHDDRRRNLEYVIAYLQRNFDTNIIVCEQGGDFFKYLQYSVGYLNFDCPIFFRTRMINWMVKESRTKIIFNWDADVVAPVSQIISSVERLRGGADFVYPYDGRFYQVGYSDSLEADINFAGTNFNCSLFKEESVGGAIGFKKESFAKAGMENENFQRYGFEDNERFVRFNKLGFKVERETGPLFHIEHFRGNNSNLKNPHYIINRSEYNRVSAMTKKELESYVATWKWA